MAGRSRQAQADGTFFISTPFHCAVGTNPEFRQLHTCVHCPTGHPSYNLNAFGGGLGFGRCQLCHITVCHKALPTIEVAQSR